MGESIEEILSYAITTCVLARDYPNYANLCYSLAFDKLIEKANSRGIKHRDKLFLLEFARVCARDTGNYGEEKRILKRLRKGYNQIGDEKLQRIKDIIDLNEFLNNFHFTGTANSVSEILEEYDILSH